MDWKRYDKMLLDPVQFWKSADVKKVIDYWIEAFAYNMCTLREGANCKAP